MKTVLSLTFLAIFASSYFVAPSLFIVGGLSLLIYSTKWTLFFVRLVYLHSFIFSDLPLSNPHTISFSVCIKLFIPVLSDLFTPSRPQNNYPIKTGFLLVLISEMVNHQCCMTQTSELALQENPRHVQIMCW